MNCGGARLKKRSRPAFCFPVAFTARAVCALRNKPWASEYLHKRHVVRFSLVLRSTQSAGAHVPQSSKIEPATPDPRRLSATQHQRIQVLVLLHT